jgi:Tfp pilus assembly protein PilO
MNRRISIVAGTLIVLLVAGWYLLLWSPQSSKLASARAADTKAVANGRQLELELAGIRAVINKLPAERAQLAGSLPVLPDNLDVDTLIDQIYQASHSSGVAWSNESQSITAATSAAATGSTGSAPETVTLNLSVAGTYDQVSNFLTALEHRQRLLVVDSVTYNPSGSNTVNTTIVVRAFWDPTAVPAAQAG